MAFSPTHPPTAYSNQSTLCVAEFQRELKKASDYSLPSIHSKRYRQVKVLLLYWDTDHLGLNVWKETERLAATFSHGYRYDCTIDKIPSQGSITSQLWLNRRLLHWAENTDQQDLLIFYYAGHGRHNKFPPESHWTMVYVVPRLRWHKQNTDGVLDQTRGECLAPTEEREVPRPRSISRQ